MQRHWQPQQLAEEQEPQVRPRRARPRLQELAAHVALPPLQVQSSRHVVEQRLPLQFLQLLQRMRRRLHEVRVAQLPLLRHPVMRMSLSSRRVARSSCRSERQDRVTGRTARQH